MSACRPNDIHGVYTCGNTSVSICVRGISLCFLGEEARNRYLVVRFIEKKEIGR